MQEFPFDDPYAVLNVEPSASSNEVRRAFRRLALKYHPDRAGPSFTPLFQTISGAYEVLADPERRRRYDRQSGRNTVAASQPAAPTAPARRASATLSRLITTLEGLLATGSARLEPDGTIVLRLAAEEALNGGFGMIAMHAAISCLRCDGAAGGCPDCGHSAVVRERVTAFLTVPPGCADGTAVEVNVDPQRKTRPVRFVLQHPRSFAPVMRGTQ